MVTDTRKGGVHASGNVLSTGKRPESGCKTLFSMLPKKTRPLQPADFRPIANIRLFYKDLERLKLFCASQGINISWLENGWNFEFKVKL